MSAGEALYVRWFPEDHARIRNYLLSCEHGQTELALEGGRPDQDAEVLGRLIEQHRVGIVGASAKADEPMTCLCEPVGWQVT